MERKFTILFCAIVFLVSGLQAQSLTLSEFSPLVYGTPDETDAHVYVDVINTGQEEIEVLWERFIKSPPPEWFSWICDNEQCYLPTSNMAAQSKPNVLQVGDTLVIQIHVNPNSVASVTDIKVELFEKGNYDTKLAIIETTFDISTSTSTKDISKEAIKVFPNPTVDYFQINYDDVDIVTVYNIVGSKMIEFDAYPNKNYDVTGLKQGIYLVRMMDDQNKVIKTVRLSKR